MTNDAIAKLAALREAASPGPWHSGPPMRATYEDHGWRRLAMMTDKKTCIFAPKGEWQLDWPHETNARLAALAPLLAEMVVEGYRALKEMQWCSKESCREFGCMCGDDALALVDKLEEALGSQEPSLS